MASLNMITSRRSSTDRALGGQFFGTIKFQTRTVLQSTHIQQKPVKKLALRRVLHKERPAVPRLSR
jgi:hypothetical protein